MSRQTVALPPDSLVFISEEALFEFTHQCRITGQDTQPDPRVLIVPAEWDEGMNCRALVGPFAAPCFLEKGEWRYLPENMKDTLAEPAVGHEVASVGNGRP